VFWREPGGTLASIDCRTMKPRWQIDDAERPVALAPNKVNGLFRW